MSWKCGSSSMPSGMGSQIGWWSILEDLLYGALALRGLGLVVGLEAEGDDAIGGLGEQGDDERDKTSWG
ncbi:hypothetical protein MMC27_007995 [Xylographa pallens]|nr:hypothetical protein [Xylographa pallens]